MALKQPVKSKNDKPKKMEQIVCDCSLLWSLAHQFTYLRLSDKTGDNEYKLVDLFAARAKRIAATYARFYLETEEGGDPKKIGRYYWMALGAFASKTMGCLLDSFQLNAMYVAFKTVPRGLGQGNLWLFTDIAASHWFYNNHRGNFNEGMRCGSYRHVNKLEETVKKITHDLPWASDSISKINNFKPSKDIIEGFQLVKIIEDESDAKIIPDHQLAQLLVIAKHEQGAVLQPLIYENPDFAYWAKAQRSWWIKWASPTYQITFTHACETNKPELKSIAPDDLVVEDFKNRMDWIGKAAEKFHGLMQSKKSYMTQELQTMAGWVNSPDAILVY